jgi:hypothetical protein
MVNGRMVNGMQGLTSADVPLDHSPFTIDHSPE